MSMQQRHSWEKAKADWYATTVLWRMTSSARENTNKIRKNRDQRNCDITGGKP